MAPFWYRRSQAQVGPAHDSAPTGDPSGPPAPPLAAYARETAELGVTCTVAPIASSPVTVRTKSSPAMGTGTPTGRSTWLSEFHAGAAEGVPSSSSEVSDEVLDIRSCTPGRSSSWFCPCAG